MTVVNVNFIAWAPSQLTAPRFGPGLNFIARFLAITFVAQKRSSTTVRVDFNQPLRSKTETTIAGNYTITGPSSVVVQSAAFTPGNSYVTLTVATTWVIGTYTVTVAAQTVESAREDRLYNAGGSTDFVAEASDLTAPVVSNISPPQGTKIAVDTAIGFKLTDSYSNLHRTDVLAYFPSLGIFEVVFYRAITGAWGSRAEGFAPNYTGTRTCNTPGADFDFTNVKRSGGWPVSNGRVVPPVIVTDAIDDAGNETT